MDANVADWVEEFGPDNDERTWKDNDPYGDILQHKLDGTTRIYFSNIRGSQDKAKWQHVCDAVKSMEVDIAGFSEINRDTSQTKVQQSLEESTRSVFRQEQTVLILSSTPTPAASEWKPGGAALLTVGGGLCSRINSIFKDELGRWAATRFQCAEDNKGLWIISIYQVCDGTIGPQSFTAARQQQALLQEPNLKPRQAFKRDLKNFVQKYPGDEFIIGGDFNEETTSADLATIIEDLDLYDLLQARHGADASPNTHISGSKCIDFILGTRSVMHSMMTCGYEPFGYRFQSDHRGVWIDLDTVSLFGNPTANMAPRESRGFSTKQPIDVRNWVTSTAKYFNDHNMTERCTQINAMDELHSEVIEQFDRDITRGSLFGEKQAVKQRPKSHWSPTFAKAWARWFFYSQAWSLRRNQVKMRQVLQSIKYRYGLDVDIPAVRDINKLRKAAQKSLRKIRLQARELRREFLRKKAEAYAAAQDKKMETILKRMEQAETTSKVFTAINKSKEASAGAVDKLEIPRVPGTPPKTCTDWKTVTIPMEIEEALLDRNQEHFGQAEGTPCTSATVRDNLGYRGDGQSAGTILDGDYDNEFDTDVSTTTMLKHLKRSINDSQMTGEITREQFLAKIKNWPEKTSTSPSKLHLGMYHALIKPSGLEPRGDGPESPAYVNFVQDRDLIIDCRLAIINACIRLGYSLDRWKEVENIMLCKDPNNCRIHRLRVIHLYEADYNLILGVKWREALYQAKDQQVLNEGTYGSRPGRSAHDPVLMEIFQNEIYRLSAKSGVAFDLDAAACYDRILAALANLASQKYGMHPKVALVNAITLEEAHFKLKTKLGPSARFYQHTEDNPIHGTGQGSQNSPTIWLFVCSTLFDAFEENAHGAIFESYDKSESITIFMVGFVDDCSQRVNDFRAHPQPTAVELVAKMQQDAQRWNDLLWSSGGLLEASKCSYHLISSAYDSKGIAFLNPNRSPIDIIIQSSTQAKPITIKSLSVFEAHRTLGVWTSPSGSMKTQLAKSLLNSARHVKRIGFCTNRREARTYYHSFFQTSIGYPHCCTSFNSKESHLIEKKFTARALTKMGFNRHMERSVTWGLGKRGGCGLMGILTEQGVAKCLTTLKFLRSNGQPGRTFRILLSWIQAQAGFGSNLLGDDTETALPHLRATWIPSLRAFLNSTGLRIRSSLIKPPPLQCEHDLYLMEWILKHENHHFKDEEVRLIAACREFLQVTTLADITDENGLSIMTSAWHGPVAAPQPAERRTHMFNTTERPPTRAWNLWRKALWPLVTNSIDRQLIHPIGRWLCNAATTRVVWPFVYSPTQHKLYIRDPQGQYWDSIEQLPFRFSVSDSRPPALPPDCVPAATTRIVFPLPVVRVDYWRQIAHVEPPPEQIHGQLATLIESMDPWERSLLAELQTTFSLQELRDWYTSTQGIVGSDGSVKNSTASFGWKLCDRAGNTIAKCNGPAPGWKPNSFRAEAYGYLSFTRFLHLLERDQTIIGPQSQVIYTDSESLLKRMAQHRKYKYEITNNTLWADWDVTNMLHQSTTTLRGTIRESWIASHQDDHQDYASLPLAARLNVDADALAEQYITDHPDPVPYVYQFPIHGGTLENSHGTITGQYKSEIRDAATWPPLKDYLCRRFDWDADLADRIDWPAMSSALSTHRGHQTTLIKHLIRQAPTGHIAHRNDPRKDPSCFCCKDAGETFLEDNNHVLRCPSTQISKWRSDYLQDIHVSLDRYNLHSDPTLLDILRDGMQRWLQDTGSLPNLAQYAPKYHPLIQEQSQIGWDQPLRGRLSLHWSRLQQEYITTYNITDNKVSGQSWSRTVAQHGISWWLKVWQLRNDTRFGDTTENKKTRLRTQIHRELALLYSKKPAMRDDDRYIFLASADVHMAAYPDDNIVLQNWLNTNEPAIRRSIHLQAQATAGD